MSSGWGRSLHLVASTACGDRRLTISDKKETFRLNLVLNVFTVTLRVCLLLCSLHILKQTAAILACSAYLPLSANIIYSWRQKREKNAPSCVLSLSDKFHSNNDQPFYATVVFRESCLRTPQSQKYLLLSSNSITSTSLPMYKLWLQ